MLSAHPGVSQAVVVAREDVPGERRLVGYVVPDDPQAVDGSSARTYLAESLPDYMVPAAVLVLDRLPVTRNGKVDRAALPAPDFAGKVTERAPRTEAERVLCALFAEVLGLERVGVEDSFFELGGDSIMSMQVVARARRAGMVLTPRQVFAERTPERLALVAGTVGTDDTGTVGRDDGVGEVPWTPVMRELGEPALRRSFAQWAIVGAPAGLERDVLVAGVAAVLDAHDMLRATVTTGDGEPELCVGPKGSLDAASLVTRVRVPDAAAESLDDVAAESLDDVAAESAREAVERLDPTVGVLLQVVWVDAGQDRMGRLALVVHHLVVDGVSWRILLPDLRDACEAAAAGRKPELDPVGTSYRKWSGRLSQEANGQHRIAELDAWTALLGGPEPALGTRGLDPALDTARTLRRRSWKLAPEHAATVLGRTPAVFHCGVHEVLLASLAGAVAQWRGDGASGLLVDVEGHGRESVEGRTCRGRWAGSPVRIRSGSNSAGWTWTTYWPAVRRPGCC
ncbi:hypothetical protein SAV31267_008690 [Streptomyces avermitilis]|uniref:Carrier domain-containing protein n=1 Tax=Streptomyces avermitilis TaxID=33903 RepID=A0A4D4MI41_STRAX|nr:hypothetical protein SAV31267_008690 [Streptomyces avermitilis]